MINSFWEFMVWVLQIKSISNNLTINEQVNKKKYNYLKDENDRFFNPFDKGNEYK